MRVLVDQARVFLNGAKNKGYGKLGPQNIPSLSRAANGRRSRAKKSLLLKRVELLLTIDQ